jgi:ribonuclease-3
MDFKTIDDKIHKDPHAKKAVKAFTQLFDQFQNKLQLNLDNRHIYMQAFMHSSFINDLQLNKIYNNERLEFLGDAVLELMVSDYIYNKFPHLPEGDLTKLRANIVCEPSLVVFAEKLDMSELILLGRGEEKTNGRERPSIVSDTFEAFLGALYMDQGSEVVNHFLHKHVFIDIRNNRYNAVVDYKTLLQEEAHKLFKKSVSYQLIEATGPSHNKEFVTGVLLDDQMVGKGRGRSKKESEQQAAKNALSKIQD